MTIYPIVYIQLHNLTDGAPDCGGPSLETEVACMTQYKTKQQIVYESLRESIQSGELLPGTPLPMTHIAQQFAVSEIPVREALRQLDQEGLVMQRPHMQAVVKDIGEDEWRWVAELRLVLEPMAAMQATGRIPEERLDQLDVLIDEMEDAMQRQDSQLYQLKNHEFHNLIYSHCPNRRLHQILGELWSAAQRFSAVYRMPGHMDAAQIEHRELVSRLRASDRTAVARTMRRHRQRILKNLTAWFEDFKEQEVREDQRKHPVSE